MGDALTPRALGRATLARQLLLDRSALDPVAAVRHLLALQAQAPPSPYLALLARLRTLDAGAVDAAFSDGRLVKASLLRLTLHAVCAEDHPWLYSAVLPALRASRLHDRRYTSSGLTTADADGALPHLLRVAAEPTAPGEVRAALEAHLGRGPQPWLWWALRTYAPLRRVPERQLPWSFGPRSPVTAAVPPQVARDEAVQEAVRRYLRAYGPAGVADVSQFTMLPRAEVRAAAASMAEELVVRRGSDGTELLDVADAPLPDDDALAPPRLLPMWDGVLLAYADRSRVVPEELRRVVIRANGDVLATVLADGRVAGVWRLVDGAVEVTAWRQLPRRDWAGLEGEAARVLALVAGRDPRPYARYDHWWPRLPAGEVRRLGE